MSAIRNYESMRDYVEKQECVLIAKYVRMDGIIERKNPFLESSPAFEDIFRGIPLLQHQLQSVSFRHLPEYTGRKCTVKYQTVDKNLGYYKLQSTCIRISQLQVNNQSVQ